MGIYHSGVLIGGATSHSKSDSHATRDATTKDSNGNEEVLEGLKSAELTVDGMFAFDAVNGIKQLRNIIDDRDQITIRLSTEEAGDEYLQCQAYITSLDEDFPNEESSTFSATFKRTGGWTRADVT